MSVHPETQQTDHGRETYHLTNSRVVLEHGPAGRLARVERDGTVEYAGPLDDATIAALREVADAHV